jgi:hypothetical protein
LFSVIHHRPATPPGWIQISHPEGVRYFYNSKKVSKATLCVKPFNLNSPADQTTITLANHFRCSIREYTLIPRSTTLPSSVTLRTVLHTSWTLALPLPFHSLTLRNSSSMYVSRKENYTQNTTASTTLYGPCSSYIPFMQAGLMLGWSYPESSPKHSSVCCSSLSMVVINEQLNRSLVYRH